jgi:hypothetical protein
MVDPEPGVDRAAEEDEVLYALSMLYVAVQRVRRHWQDHGKPEVWTSFEDIYLRDLIPRAGAAPDPVRAGRSATSGATARPNQRTYNRAVSVLRVIRRVIPAIIPADLCDRSTPEERYQEWCSILARSRAVRDLPIWLAFLQPPALSSDAPSVNSENIGMTPGSLTAGDPVDQRSRQDRAGSEFEAAIRAKVDADAERERREAESDELQVLLAFWLAMPFRDYITVPPAIGAGDTDSALSLRRLTAQQPGSSSTAEVLALLTRVKDFAKQVHQIVTEGLKQNIGAAAPRRTHSMPAEVAQVLYHLCVALALTRYDAQIASLPPETVQRNFIWVASRRWLIPELRPVFAEALHRFSPAEPVL